MILRLGDAGRTASLSVFKAIVGQAKGVLRRFTNAGSGASSIFRSAHGAQNLNRGRATRGERL